jgi:hypothetical protein
VVLTVPNAIRIYMQEPKIMRMDWRSAGYWPVYKDGKKVWVPKDAVQETSQDESTSA